MSKRILKKIIAISLALCTLFSLSACRYSDTIQQILYDRMRDGLIDIYAPFQFSENEPDNDDKSDDLPDVERDDDSERDLEREDLGIVLPDDVLEEILEQYAEDYGYTQSGYEVVYVESGGQVDVPMDVPDTGTEESETIEEPETETETETDEETQEEPVIGETGDETMEAGGEENEDESESIGDVSNEVEDESGVDNSGDENEEEPSDPSNEEQSVEENNDDGQKVPLPSGSAFAATGASAQMLIMLDIAENLVATDAATLAESYNWGEDSEIASLHENAVECWNGDGSGGLTEDGLNYLLNYDEPGLLMYIDGDGTFSSSDLSQLKAAGWGQVVLQVLDGKANLEKNAKTIVDAVKKIVPEVLDNYETLLNWLDDTAKKNGFTGNTYYTLYIDGWDDTIESILYNTYDCVKLLGWNGMAYIRPYVYPHTTIISGWMEYGGVHNTVKDQAYGSNSSGYTPLYYSPWGSNNGSTDSFTIIGGLGYKIYSASYVYCRVGGASGNIMLGTQLFKHLIAADQATADAILVSKNLVDEDGDPCGQWSIFKKTAGDGAFVARGTPIWSFSGKEILVTFLPVGEGYDYDIIFNPKGGYASWTDGTVEGVLYGVWAARYVAERINDEEMYDIIKNFYSTFYRYELSESEINSFLEEVK